MGKNELSAHVEAFLLYAHRLAGGTIVKAAPTFKPQLINSKMRLERVLSHLPGELPRAVQSRFGYIIQMGEAAVHFLSAEESSNVVGATADLLLEIDEAQDVSEEKYLKDFRPMASTANTTAVLYGTAWSDDTMLARQRAANLRDDPGAHFEFPWTVLADLSPDYRAFVEGERRRLGDDHPIVKTQYRLETVDGAGRLFNAEQLELLKGSHPRVAGQDEGSGFLYVAGVDVAGESERAPDEVVRSSKPRKDSTVATIARVSYPAELLGEPLMELVQHHWWTGRDHSTQYSALLELLKVRWRCSMVCVDATGVGAGVASWLGRAMAERVEAVQFSRPVKSQLGYDLLAAANAGRLRMYAADGSAEWREFWEEARLCRYSIYQNTAMSFFVDDKDGHDDFVISLGLCVRAAARAAPEPAGGIVPARRLYDDGRY
jgi:GNAT superfamily N-acetyltransferase